MRVERRVRSMRVESVQDRHNIKQEDHVTKELYAYFFLVVK